MTAWRSIDPYSVEVSLGQAAYPATREYPSRPEAREPVVLLEAVTVHEDTFDQVPDPELRSMAMATVAGELDDPRVMLRRVALTVEAATDLAEQLRSALAFLAG
jgi:hypothetical protein